jgi:Immunoglobulin I-set domain.
MAIDNGPVLYHKVDVSTEELLRPKIVTPLPVQTRAKVGSEFKLLCLLTGYPPIQINWYLNGELLEASEDGRIFFDNHKRLLVIRELRMCDTGSIAFQAINKYGDVSCSCYLDVTGKREKESRDPYRYGNHSPKPIRRLMHALQRMKSF